MKVVVLILAASLCTACTTAAKRADDTFANGGITQSRGEIARALKSRRTREPGELAEAPTPELCTSPTEEMLAKLAHDYTSTLAACEVKLNKYEARSDSSRKVALGLALFGALAGSVVVPTLTAGTAAKSTIAAWGGIAGGMNLAQRSLNDQGLDAATYISRRELIRTELLPSLKRYSSAESDYCDRVMAITEMAAACVAYAIAGNQTPPSPSSETPTPTEPDEEKEENAEPEPEAEPEAEPEPEPAQAGEPAPVDPTPSD